MGKYFNERQTEANVFLTWERNFHQGDLISTFLFVLAFEIIFPLVKLKTELEVMTIFDYNYLYSAYADDTTFF